MPARMALPGDFAKRPTRERHEILERVSSVIAGTADYRRFQREATQQRFSLRFLRIDCGDFGGGERVAAEADSVDEHLSGCRDAPLQSPWLRHSASPSPAA